MRKILIGLFMMIWACSSSNQNGQKKAGYVFYDSKSKMLYYKVTGVDDFCVALHSSISMDGNSLFIISYDTTINLDYNGFPEPEIICSDSTRILSGVVTGLTMIDSASSEYDYFIRVYNKSFQSYVKENKILVPEVSDFENFEHKHGEVIKLTPVERKW